MDKELPPPKFEVFSDRTTKNTTLLTLPEGYKVLAGGATIHGSATLSSCYPTSTNQWVAKQEKVQAASLLTLNVVAVHDPKDEFEVVINSITQEEMEELEEMKAEENALAAGEVVELGDAGNNDDEYVARLQSAARENEDIFNEQDVIGGYTEKQVRRTFSTQTASSRSRSKGRSESMAAMSARSASRRPDIDELGMAVGPVELRCEPPHGFQLIGGGFDGPSSRVVTCVGPSNDSTSWTMTSDAHPLLKAYAIGIRRREPLLPTEETNGLDESGFSSPVKRASTPPPCEEDEDYGALLIPAAKKETDDNEEDIQDPDPLRIVIRLANGKWYAHLGAGFGDMAFYFGASSEQDKAAAAKHVMPSENARMSLSKAPPSLWMEYRRPVSKEQLGNAAAQYCRTTSKGVGSSSAAKRRNVGGRGK